MKTNLVSTWQLGSIVILAPSKRTLNAVIMAMILITLSLVFSLMLGKNGITPDDFITLFKGEATPYQDWLFWQSRLPRALCAIGAGAALGISGAVFQTLTKNPLGSPDIIGINAGASAGAVLWLWFLPNQPIAIGALLGAVSVLTIMLIALGKSWQLSRQLVLLGIAINAFAVATVQLILTLVQREQAQQLFGYLSGSLANRNWQDVSVIFMTLIIFVPLLLLLARRLSLLTQGYDSAIVLGSRVDTTQWQALLLASGLALGAVLTVGPVAFVALVAPHLARFGHSRLALLRSAIYGSLLLLVSDTITLTLPGLFRMPVGVLTALIGGLYLVGLLSRQVTNK